MTRRSRAAPMPGMAVSASEPAGDGKQAHP
jgi:hypothetical protein